MADISEVRTLKVAPKVQAEVDNFDLEACRSSLRARAWDVLCFLLLVTIWWIAAICVVLVIKVTVGSGDKAAFFPYSFTLTSFANTTTGLLAWLTSAVMRKLGMEGSVPKMRRDEVLKLMAIGLIQGVEIGINNKVLEYLSMSGRTMLNSVNVLFMMCTAMCWKLERLGALRFIAVMCLTFGGAMQGLASDDQTAGAPIEATSTHMKGVLLLLFAMVTGAQRWALMQFVLQRSEPGSALAKMSKMRYMTVIMPVTGAVCFIMAAFSEREAFRSEHLFGSTLALSILKIATGVLALSVAELKLVHLTSAVAMQVLATIHQIPIVLAGVFFFHDHINKYGMFGFAFCMTGAFFYVAARRRDARAEAPEFPARAGEDQEGEQLVPTIFGTADDPTSPSNGQSAAATPSRLSPRNANLSSMAKGLSPKHANLSAGGDGMVQLPMAAMNHAAFEVEHSTMKHDSPKSH